MDQSEVSALPAGCSHELKLCLNLQETIYKCIVPYDANIAI